MLCVKKMEELGGYQKKKVRRRMVTDRYRSCDSYVKVKIMANCGQKITLYTPRIRSEMEQKRSGEERGNVLNGVL